MSEIKDLSPEELQEFHKDETTFEANVMTDLIIKRMEYAEFDRDMLIGYISQAINNSTVKINQP